MKRSARETREVLEQMLVAVGGEIPSDLRQQPHDASVSEEANAKAADDEPQRQWLMARFTETVLSQARLLLAVMFAVGVVALSSFGVALNWAPMDYVPASVTLLLVLAAGWLFVRLEWSPQWR